MVRATLTYEDLQTLPADGKRYELHDGELSVTPAPGTEHQRVLTRVLAILHQHAESHGLGVVLASPVDCILSERNVVQPDIVFVATRHLGRVSPRAIEGAPTLAIEIVSPSSVSADRGIRKDLYARFGVEHYWVVDPASRTIDAWRLTQTGWAPAGRLIAERTTLAPFDDLALDPTAIWP